MNFWKLHYDIHLSLENCKVNVKKKKKREKEIKLD